MGMAIPTGASSTPDTRKKYTYSTGESSATATQPTTTATAPTETATTAPTTATTPTGVTPTQPTAQPQQLSPIEKISASVAVPSRLAKNPMEGVSPLQSNVPVQQQQQPTDWNKVYDNATSQYKSNAPVEGTNLPPSQPATNWDDFFKTPWAGAKNDVVNPDDDFNNTPDVNIEIPTDERTQIQKMMDNYFAEYEQMKKDEKRDLRWSKLTDGLRALGNIITTNKGGVSTYDQTKNSNEARSKEYWKNRFDNHHKAISNILQGDALAQRKLYQAAQIENWGKQRSYELESLALRKAVAEHNIQFKDKQEENRYKEFETKMEFERQKWSDEYSIKRAKQELDQLKAEWEKANKDGTLEVKRGELRAKQAYWNGLLKLKGEANEIQRYKATHPSNGGNGSNKKVTRKITREGDNGEMIEDFIY